MIFPKKEKTLTFEKAVFDSGLVPNIGAAVVLIFYIFFFAQITGRQFLSSGFIALGILALMQFVLGPFTNANSTRAISKKIAEWQETGLPKAERTDLLIALLNCPKHVGKSVFAVFGSGTMIWVLSFYFYVKVDMMTELFIIVSSLLADYVAAILGIDAAEKVCSVYAVKLINDGVDEDIVKEQKYFGVSTVKYFCLFILLPVLMTNLTTFMFVWKKTAQITSLSGSPVMLQMMLVIGFNIALTSSLAFVFGSRFYSYVRQMRDALNGILENDVTNSNKVPSDLSNEISYNMHLINNVVVLFRTILQKAQTIGKSILQSTQDLVVISNENSATSLEQSAGVKEIVGAMEDSDTLSRNISAKVNGVASAAQKMTANVQEGFATLQINLEKMHEITEANVETITGIKMLGEKIENIWEIVKIINNIADQTKIIAFNAELEAASAGEAGKNFHIVANEIRRLADNTVESTMEIKERITEIQHSSDSLIVASEGGTSKINEGCALSEKLEKNFSDIHYSSEETESSSHEIKMIVEQQTAAFEQIIITLRQMSAGIETFSSSTQMVNEASIHLRKVADELAVLNTIV